VEGAAVTRSVDAKLACGCCVARMILAEATDAQPVQVGANHYTICAEHETQYAKDADGRAEHYAALLAALDAAQKL